MPTSRLPLIVVLLTTSSCVTLGRHEELEKRVQELEDQIRQNDEREAQRFQNVGTLVREKTEEIRKDVARLGAQLGSQGEDVRTINGRLEEIDHLTGRLAGEGTIIKKFLDERFGLTVEALPANLPSEPGQQFEAGQKAFESGQLDQARTILRHFARNSPDHEKALRARLLIGETYRKQRRWKNALREYHDVFQDYESASAQKTPPEAPEALWLAGQTLEESGECQKARDMNGFLVKKYRKTDMGDRGKRRLDSLKCR